jgi:hypothetical protein
MIMQLLVTAAAAGLLIGAAPIEPVAGPPSLVEAEALGVRLARTTGILTVAPMLVEKDTIGLADEDKTLTPTERTRLLIIGREEGRTGLDRIAAALGHGYAKRLSLADLRVLVAQNESPAAVNFRASVPAVLSEAMAGVGSIDLKKATSERACREIGKFCNRH